ncbi:hypothetical protein PMAYCL1PPCAC_22460, partial [Pristionchus mayeri]
VMAEPSSLSDKLELILPFLSFDSPDLRESLKQKPNKIVTREIQGLRVEKAHQKMELGNMASTFKTALALKNRKIKDLEEEVKELRGRNEELTKELENNAKKRKGSKKRGGNNSTAKDEIARLPKSELNTTSVANIPMHEESASLMLHLQQNLRVYLGFSLVGWRIQGLLLGRVRCDKGDHKASAESILRLSELAAQLDRKGVGDLSRFMGNPKFTCFCGVYLCSGLAVINHFNDDKHVELRPNHLCDADISFWTEKLRELLRGMSLYQLVWIEESASDVEEI